jgi:predicted nucleic acid-binding Zn finger protein
MSKDLLFLISDKLEKKKDIDKEFIDYLEELFPNKSNTILEVVNRDIAKYIYKPSNRIVWTVMSAQKSKKPYLIYPKLYCSCIDFYKEVVLNSNKQFCKHIIAQVICEVLKKYREVELKDIDFKNSVKDLKLKF